jgi:miniconductance mechanosensitive channel
LRKWGLDFGFGADSADGMASLIGLAALVLAAVVAYFGTRRLMLRLARLLAKRTRTVIDDALLEAHAFSRFALLVPTIVVQRGMPLVLEPGSSFLEPLDNICFIAAIVILVAVFSSLLDAGEAVYSTYEISRRFQIKGLLQAVKIVVLIVAGISIFGLVVGRSPLAFLGGLGALGAVLTLIFQDSILGLVAGFQLSANDMVRIGDWIEMSQHGADGDVVDITLTTVKVQNWDKTIITIPTHALVADSFRNWRGMQESGGRRIKRSVNIDVTSVRFCDEEMIGRFRKIALVRDYLDRKVGEIEQFNRDRGVDGSSPANGRRLTNVGTFRAYLEAYLHHHPMLNEEMTFMVRQLPPGEGGLPIEIYVFSSDQNWVSYEALQSDLFDHILAVVPLFDLRIFQTPTGADLRSLEAGASPARARDDV